MAQAETKRKKILIVEDEEYLRDALAINLSDEGFEVSKAGNGIEGLETALKEHPDFVLIDIIMPEMDGIAMLKKMREDSWGKDADVMLLTNLSSMDKIADAAEYNAKEYLIKADLTLAQITEKIKEKFRLLEAK